MCESTNFYFYNIGLMVKSKGFDINIINYINMGRYLFDKILQKKYTIVATIYIYIYKANI